MKQHWEHWMEGIKTYPFVEWSHKSAVLPNIVTGKLSKLPETPRGWRYVANVLTINKEIHNVRQPFHTVSVKVGWEICILQYSKRKQTRTTFKRNILGYIFLLLPMRAGKSILIRSRAPVKGGTHQTITQWITTTRKIIVTADFHEINFTGSGPLSVRTVRR